MTDMGIPDPNDGVLPGAERTLWTLVVGAAAGPEGPEAVAARESLALQYWGPLYVYVRRKLGNEEEARDVVQSFFAERVLGGTVVARADREAGSFRWLLLVAPLRRISAPLAAGIMRAVAARLRVKIFINDQCALNCRAALVHQICAGRPVTMSGKGRRRGK